MTLPRITARQRALRSFLFAGMAAFAFPCLGEGVDVQYNEQGQWVDVSENGVPVLRYNHGVTPVPDGVDKAFERGDYVSALYGPNGELLTEDFPADHVHHRAVNWSWATVKWNNETRDMFAVRNPYEGPVTGGLWARPVRIMRAARGPSPEGGPGPGVIRAKSEWRWDDKTPIVAEHVQITVYPKTNAGRLIDFLIELEPLVDGLEFCGRLDAGYSGFNIRMAPGEGRQIAFHTDPPDANPRMAWADYTAAFKGGDGITGVALLQHKDNPMYPHEWREYPDLNFFQPIFPGGQLVPMPKGLVVRLGFRLWVHSGTLSEEALSTAWKTYNGLPGPTSEKSRLPFTEFAQVELARVFAPCYALDTGQRLSDTMKRDLETCVSDEINWMFTADPDAFLRMSQRFNPRALANDSLAADSLSAHSRQYPAQTKRIGFADVPFLVTNPVLTRRSEQRLDKETLVIRVFIASCDESDEYHLREFAYWFDAERKLFCPLSATGTRADKTKDDIERFLKTHTMPQPWPTNARSAGNAGNASVK